MPEGVIAGGWSYVTAAYFVTVIGLLVYGSSLLRRWRHEQRKEKGHD